MNLNFNLNSGLNKFSDIDIDFDIGEILVDLTKSKSKYKCKIPQNNEDINISCISSISNKHDMGMIIDDIDLEKLVTVSDFQIPQSEIYVKKSLSKNCKNFTNFPNLTKSASKKFEDKCPTVSRPQEVLDNYTLKNPLLDYLNQIDLVQLLHEIISLKKENNYLSDREKFLERIMLQKRSDSIFTNYLKSDFFKETENKDRQVRNLLGINLKDFSLEYRYPIYPNLNENQSRNISGKNYKTEKKGRKKNNFSNTTTSAVKTKSNNKK